MEKSIEKIWKEGFLNSDALIAPKLNDLYNQKSKNTVDKLMKIGKMNLVAVMIAAFIILIGSIIAGVPFTGVLLFLLLSWVVIYGKKQASRIKEIDKSLSSYQYIKDVDSWVKEVISGYTRMYRILYPAFVLIFTFGIWFSSYGDEMFREILLKSPDLFVIFGIPAIWVLSIVFFAGLISLFAGPIYKFDLNLVYGRVFNKLDDLLADMEELRS